MIRKTVLVFLVFLLLAVFISAYLLLQTPPAALKPFDAQQAYQDVVLQVQFGPRIPGSESHARTIQWITDELKKAGWKTEIQSTTRMGHPIKNVIARRSPDPAAVILAAHYDTRLIAENDPDPQKRNQPVPGANDGASGVAVLLEIARCLPKDLPSNVWLVFLDAEDQGNLPGWDWILGSRAFVETLTTKPDAVIIVDMIGDADLTLYQEQNSTPDLNATIWQTAAQLGYQKTFINQRKHSILDDHIPFLERGIKAIDMIDIEYRYWHTTADTPDKVSPNSLKIVGDTLLQWLITLNNSEKTITPTVGKIP